MTKRRQNSEKLSRGPTQSLLGLASPGDKSPDGRNTALVSVQTGDSMGETRWPGRGLINLEE